MLLPPYAIDSRFTLGLGALSLLLPMDGLDITGRSLMEGRSYGYPPSREDYRMESYDDCRKGTDFPTNGGALVHAMRSRKEIDANVRRFVDLTSRALTTEVGDEDRSLWRCVFSAYAVYKLPLLGFLRECRGQPCDLDPATAAASKICHGVLDASLRAICYQADVARPITPATLEAFVQKTGSLVGRSEVCPASPAMILGFLENFFPETWEDRRSSPPSDTGLQALGFPVVCWYLDACLLCYNHLRLSSIVSRNRCLDVPRHVVPSYQRAMSVSDAVLDDRVLADCLIYGTMKCGWETPGTATIAGLARDFIATYREAALRRPSAVENRTLPMEQISATAATIIAECGSCLTSEFGFPPASVDIDRHLLEVLFGELD